MPSVAGFKGFPWVSAGWHLPTFEPHLAAELQSFSRCQQRLPASSRHAIQNHPRSAGRHSGPQWGHSHRRLLHFQRFYRDPQGRCGGGHTRWAEATVGAAYTVPFVCLFFHRTHLVPTKPQPKLSLPFAHTSLCVVLPEVLWARLHSHSTVALIINRASSLIQAA